MVIPQGKQLRMTRGGKIPVVSINIPLVLDEDITLSLSSSFSPLFGGGDTKWLNLLGAGIGEVTGGRFSFSGQFKQLGYQLWQKTDPLSFSATLGFHMGIGGFNDGEIEVYNPIMALASLPLPREGGKLGSLIAPGPRPIAGILGSADDGTDQEEGSIHSSEIIAIEIGKILRIDSIIVTKAEPMFSQETDDKGFPIWGKITLDITSTFSATVEMISHRKWEAPGYSN